MRLKQGHVLAATTQGVQIIVFPEYGLFSDNFESRDSIYPYLEQIPSVSGEATRHSSYFVS